MIAGNAVDAFSRAGAVILTNGLRDSLGSARRHDASIKFAIGAARMVLPAIKAARTVRELARGYGADLIHTNGLRAHILTPLLAKEYPVVWSLRDVPSGWMARVITRRAARAATVITAPSSFAARFASRSGRPVHVIPNPVERPTVLGIEVARNRLGIHQGRAVVAVAGHMHPVHGHHIAVAAWRKLALPRPLLLLAGGDLYGGASTRYRQALRSSIGQMGLDDDVVLLGLVDAADLYAASDLVVHPALHPEGFGRVMAEAQLAGVPVIATSLGAACELIDDGQSGLLVPPGNASALADAVRRVLDDPLLSERLRSGGLAAGERYRPEVHAAAMESVYRTVTA